MNMKEKRKAIWAMTGKGTYGITYSQINSMMKSILSDKKKYHVITERTYRKINRIMKMQQYGTDRLRKVI
jgi:hypothetical protein